MQFIRNQPSCSLRFLSVLAYGVLSHIVYTAEMCGYIQPIWYRNLHSLSEASPSALVALNISFRNSCRLSDEGFPTWSERGLLRRKLRKSTHGFQWLRTVFCNYRPENHNPPTSMYEVVFRFDALTGCGDLIFSSHTLVAINFALCVNHYCTRRIVKVRQNMWNLSCETTWGSLVSPQEIPALNVVTRSTKRNWYDNEANGGCKSLCLCGWYCIESFASFLSIGALSKYDTTRVLDFFVASCHIFECLPPLI